MSERPLIWLDPELPETAQEFARMAEAPRIAVDLEADSYHHYYEKVCLVQFSLPDRDYFFDPLKHELPAALRKAMEGAGPLLLMHGADFDVRMLKKDKNLSLGQLFDTHLAARFLGREKTGLASLLESELAILIDKKQQRSDWSRRPLGEQQLEYARKDTCYLFDLVDRLQGELKEMGRLHWVEEECALQRDVVPSEKEFNPDAWRKIKGSKELGPKGRRAIAALFVWREEQAKLRDDAPFRVVPNHALLQAAIRCDERRGVPEVAKWKFLPKNVEPDTWRNLIREAYMRDDPGPRGPRKPTTSPPQPEVADRIEKLKALRKSESARLGLEMGLILPSGLMANLAREAPQSESQLREVEGMTEWRVEAVGTAILGTLTP